MAQASTLARQHPVVLSAVAFAVGYGVYTAYTFYSSKPVASSLRRSNAVHRTRPRERVSHGFELVNSTPDHPLGMIIIRHGEDAFAINIATDPLPSGRSLQQFYSPAASEEVRKAINEAAVDLVLSACLTATHHAETWTQVAPFGFGELLAAMLARDEEEIRHHGRQIPATLQADGISDEQVQLALTRFLNSERWAQAMFESGSEDALEPPETDDLEAANVANREPSHGLRGLLYYIAEEDAKRKAYEHRGIHCEECSESPIRGVRYHCLNCSDYDLCAACEQHTAHQKTHVFAKIKIPLPVLSQPTKEYRLWYPGDPRKIHGPLDLSLKKRLCQTYELEETQMDALYDQFVCNANAPLHADKLSVKAAIDRRAFNKAFTSERWHGRFSANAVHDRMFAFYDTDCNGVIDFEEFVCGVAYLKGPRRFASLTRAIRGFDVDGDGFVGRDDFLRLLRAKHEIQKQMMIDMVEAQEVEQTQSAQEILQSSQPISAIFSQEEIPQGESRPRRGKQLNAVGDMQPINGSPFVLENDDPWPMSASTRSIHEQLRSRFDSMLYGGPSDDISTEDFPQDVTNQVDGLTSPGAPPNNGGQSGHLPVIELNADDTDEEVLPHVEDIIWQTTQNGLNELLDRIFDGREEGDDEAISTGSDREKWRKEIDELKEADRKAQIELAAAQDDPLVATAMNSSSRDARSSGQTQKQGREAFKADVSPTDWESLEKREQDISNSSLNDLLDSSGFGVRENSDSPSESTSPHAAHIGASSIWNGNSRHMATSPLREVTSTEDEEDFDPTLPQNRPSEVADVKSSDAVSGNGKPVPPTLPERSPPSKERLRYLAGLDEAEREMKNRGGFGRLNYDEIEHMAVNDSTGEVRGLIKSWLEWASF